ncbi:hypothetical protein [Nitrosopumilus sp.]|uniref:hypothetical protein n=1 Tax=Nitrosopumilus sp. TaxID=2024843 RepID=UPI00247DEF8B|nr:hypothetical protein [Nitrosopumilus sp.]MCV0410238.1 hypothetical protein [Nitrosopumilus sp.]
MIFSKKKITLDYTVEKCSNCGMQIKRKFSDGDVLFAEYSKCDSCGEMCLIEKIFGETLEQ